MPKSNTPRQSLAWVPYWDQEEALSSINKYPEKFDYVSLYWFALTKDTQIEAYPYASANPAIVSDLRQQGIKVLALIANLPTENEGGDWDPHRVKQVISTPQARSRHIQDIVNMARAYNVDGVNIDYEALSGEERDSFTIFIKELSQALHQDSKILAVALHPKPHENDPRYSNGSQAQDWIKLGYYADQLHLMTYEQHWATSSPGPAAEVQWSKNIVSYALKTIPSHKIFVGIPLYGYDWPPEGPAKGLTYEDVQQLVRDYNAQPIWDEAGASWYFTYTDEADDDHEVWYEDARSVRAKRAVSENLGVGQFAYWRLGGEDERVWKKEE